MDLTIKFCLRYSSPAIDISFFIYSCTTEDLREQHYDDLLKVCTISLLSNYLITYVDCFRLFSLEIFPVSVSIFPISQLIVSLFATNIMLSFFIIRLIMTACLNLSKILDPTRRFCSPFLL